MEANTDIRHLEARCKQLEKDKSQLKKALGQREQGESSLRVQIEEEQRSRREMLQEKERLKQELRKLKTQQLPEAVGEPVATWSSSSSAGTAMIEVDLTSELAEYA
mmetsp:Transcript_11567/g.21932  ORF Transcript_11567/g.21932 Transcript_11567/m.21932 type:complete len:106 (+) Transcript_11567:635-952(+)